MTGDLVALQGEWIQIGFEQDGLADARDSYDGAMGAVTTIAGDHFSVRNARGVLLLEGNFTLDETTHPKRIIWADSMGSDAGKHLPAIYELNGDDFVFSAADAGAPYPATFQTAPGQTLRRFARKA
jgi:uncharacterized protein (TIGR03067 family)